MAILIFVLGLNTCKVSRLPMEAYQPTNQELGAVFGCFCKRLVQEKGITNRPIEDAIENMRKSFALSLCQFD